MFRRFVGIFVLCTILAAGASCTRLGKLGPGEKNLAVITLPQPDSIPAGWGRLVSVSSAPGVENWVQLWLQDDQGTIRVASYNVKDNHLHTQAVMIGRD